MSKMEKIKRKKDKHETALIRSTVEYVEIECKKNVDNIYAKKLGQPIHYGDDIELLHLESGLFLTLTKDRYGGINTNHSSFYSKTAYEYIYYIYIYIYIGHIYKRLRMNILYSRLKKLLLNIQREMRKT